VERRSLDRARGDGEAAVPVRRLDRSAEGTWRRGLLSTIRWLFVERRSLGFARGDGEAAVPVRRIERSAEGAEWRDLLSTIGRLFVERRSLDCARDDGMLLFPSVVSTEAPKARSGETFSRRLDGCS
jgi:hypothetical protein